MLTPPGVQSCFDATSDGCSGTVFCAYHSYAPYEGSQIIYADLPELGSKCEPAQRPDDSSAEAVLNSLSHEHIESITDPEPNGGWEELAPIEEELADKCEASYGQPLGSNADGEYNEVINGHEYYTQEIWSNQGHECMQRLTFIGQTPTASFTSRTLPGGAIELNARASTPTGGVAKYSWQLNANGPPIPTSAPIETSSPKTTVVLGAGSYNIALTVYTQDGTSSGTAHTVTVVTDSPQVLTAAATAISQKTATLSNATVDPDGSPVTECMFEYGPTRAYGASAPCASAPGSGHNAVAASADLAGLGVNTGYHFRVVARNAQRTTDGADASFTTLPNPLDRRPRTGLECRNARATLNGVVAAGQNNIARCVFEYSTSSPVPVGAARAKCLKPAPVQAGPEPETAVIGSLASGTTYHDRLSVEYKGRGATFTASSEEGSFRTQGAGVSLQTPELSPTGAVVKANIDPNGSAVSACSVEWGTTKHLKNVLPCSPAPPFETVDASRATAPIRRGCTEAPPRPPRDGRPTNRAPARATCAFPDAGDARLPRPRPARLPSDPGCRRTASAPSTPTAGK